MRMAPAYKADDVHPAPWCRVFALGEAKCWSSGVLVCFLAVWLAASFQTNASPAYPLKASANGRHLVDSNNMPVLLTGDSPQALFVKLTEAEAGLFLTNRAERGFNSLWVNLLCATNNGGLPNGVTTDGVAPFTNTIPSTGIYDLTTPNEAYLAHVDRVLNVAAQLGIQIMLDPLETSVGGWTATALTNGTNRCRIYGEYLGNRYKDFDNLIWWSGNDFQDWTNAVSDSVVRAIAQGIKNMDMRHLHTLMLDYPVSGSLDNTNWQPILGLNASYTYWPTYAQVLADYNRTNFLPTFMAEAHYEFENLYNAYGSPEVLRRQAYWSLLSGACGQFMGNHFTWQFIEGWQTNMDTVGSLQMTNVKFLFESRRWSDLIPDQTHTVVTAGYGTFATSGSLTNNNYAPAARTADGALVMVYMPTVRTITVDMTKLSASAKAQWFDPVSGVYSTIVGSPFTNVSSRTFTPAGTNSGGVGDWVLVLETSLVDILPPAAPPGLTATAVSLHQVNLSWGNSSDNVGVVGYRVERCAGADCDTFTQVATVSSNGFSDVGLPAGTVFGYRVAAADASTNISSYSSIATGATWTVPVSWSGLVAEYAFEEGAGETAADASGNGNTGWVGGAAWASPGKFGGALVFNGASFMTVSNSPSLNVTNGLTMEAWVYLTAASGNRSTISMREASGGLAYLLEADAANLPVISITTATGGLQSATGPAPLPLNVWTHVAGTYDGSSLCMFVNGTLVASNAASGDVATSVGPLRVGGNAMWGGFFTGRIDGVRLYNRALKPTEVAAYMNRAAGAVPSIQLNVPPQNSVELATNGFQLLLSADLPASYAIESTTNFATWETLAVVQYTNGLTLITDRGAVLPEAGFYRALAAEGSPQILLNTPAQSREQIVAGGFRMLVTADAPATLLFERTTDFISWQPAGALNYTNGQAEFIDPPFRLPPVRFYRVRWL